MIILGVHMKKAFSFILAIVIGTILAYAWSSLSWVVFPFHEWTFKTFTNTEAVTQAITANAPESGMYIIPTCENHLDVVHGPLLLCVCKELILTW